VDYSEIHSEYPEICFVIEEKFSPSLVRVFRENILKKILKHSGQKYFLG